MKTLLIHPPFSMPDKPYISVPSLSGFLKRQGAQVSAIDANIEFYHRFLSSERLARSVTHANTRFLELNARRALDDCDRTEYAALLETLLCLQQHGIPDGIFHAPASAVDVRLRRFREALRLACLPHWPARLDFSPNTGYIRYHSPFRKFSSADLLASVEQSSVLHELLADILRSELLGLQPEVTGISVTFPDQVTPAFICARIVKQLLPSTHVVMGGTFVSAHLRRVSDSRLFRDVDSMVVDDGELPLLRLLEQIGREKPELSRVPGLVYPVSGGLAHNEPAPPVDLLEAGPPDYGVFELDRYLMPLDRMALLFRLSRGCSWGRCAFCKIELPFIHRHQQPPAEPLYDQLRELVTTTGLQFVYFSDDSASPEILEVLSRRLVEDGLKTGWVANLRIERSLSLQRLLQFQQGGCLGLYFGLESYNDRLLKAMEKGTTVAMIDETLSKLSWTGIPATAYMIVGFPTETEDEAMRSFEGVKRLLRKGWLHSCIYNVFELSPYSAVWREPARFGVTRIHVAEGLDLAPPTTAFECEGMSRARALELCAQFVDELAKLKGPPKAASTAWPSFVAVAGRAVPVRFNPIDAPSPACQAGPETSAKSTFGGSAA